MVKKKMIIEKKTEVFGVNKKNHDDDAQEWKASSAFADILMEVWTWVILWYTEC